MGSRNWEVLVRSPTLPHGGMENPPLNLFVLGWTSDSNVLHCGGQESWWVASNFPILLKSEVFEK